MGYLEQINSIEDFKSLPRDCFPALAEELRCFIYETVMKNGGHLASNLGSVELTLALHYVFDSPYDKIVWDVGHQAYVHKILTGRRERFDTLRTEGGISGFPHPSESKHDTGVSGHSSTSISTAVGLARARDLRGENNNIIAVIGDGALTGGLAFEALNDIGERKTKVLVILNDNKMSISRNVGGTARLLARLRLSKKYAKLKHSVRGFVGNVPIVGNNLITFIEKAKSIAKYTLINGKMFEQIGIKYVGPVDGHDTEGLITVLGQIRKIKEPVMLHVITSKGKGRFAIECDPQTFHGVNACPENGSSFSAAAGKTLTALAASDPNIVAISAAMADGTGMTHFKEAHPDRFFDVGIAEAHAVTCAAGMAAAGLKPYVAIYSTFLQRAYDQIIHDVCLARLPVRFLVDRAGIAGEDGSTHQGIYDLSYLRQMNGMTIAAPKDVAELESMLKWSVSFDGPLAIRYPKNCAQKYNSHIPVELGKWEMLHAGSSQVCLIGVGCRMLELAESADGDNTVISARFINPIDEEMLLNIKDKKIIILEENISIGGLYSAVLDFYARRGIFAQVRTLGIDNSVISHGTFDSTCARIGLDKSALNEFISLYK